jgi:HEAT repeat protein
MAIKDNDPKVRATAVHLLWECEEHDLVPVFLGMLSDDPDESVRAAVATALGKYIYLGEVEDLPQKTLHQIEGSLLKAIVGQDADLVRRRALESMGFSSRDEIPGLIEDAFHSKDEDWKVSALFAMGRSASQQWRKPVLATLNARPAALRLEAARAAGDLELHEAREKLLELLDDEEDDVRTAVIWSLSQIGGEGVRQTLVELQELAEEDEEIEYLEAALDNLSFTEGVSLIDLLDVPEDEVELESGEADLEDIEADVEDETYVEDEEADED